MLRTLAFIAVRQQKHQAGGQIPFVFAGAQELIDDHLRAVDEISELRFPQNQRFRIVAAEAVFESDASRFGERRVVNLAKRLLAREMRERQVVVLGFRIDQHGVPLIERAALRVLPGKTNGRAFEHQRTKGQRFRKAVVDGALAVAHLAALLQQFRDFRMQVKARRHAHEPVGEFRELFLRQPGVDFVRRIVFPVLVGRPIVRQLAQMRDLLQLPALLSAPLRILFSPLRRLARRRCPCARRKSSRAAHDS